MPKKTSRRKTSRKKSSRKKAGHWYAFSYRVGSKRIVKGKRKPVRTKTAALKAARRMSKRLNKKVSLVKVR